MVDVKQLDIFDQKLSKLSKRWPFVTEEGGSIATLQYNLGVSGFKCKD